MFSRAAGHIILSGVSRDGVRSLTEQPLTGKSIVLYENGDKYVGQLRNGRREGQGENVTPAFAAATTADALVVALLLRIMSERIGVSVGVYVYADMATYKGTWSADFLNGVWHPQTGTETDTQTQSLSHSHPVPAVLHHCV